MSGEGEEGEEVVSLPPWDSLLLSRKVELEEGEEAEGEGEREEEE